MSYAITRKSDKKFFTGFSLDNSPVFGGKEEAKIFGSEASAKTQALFLVNYDRNVQRKPVKI